MEGQPAVMSVSQFIFRGLMMSRCGAPGGGVMTPGDLLLQESVNDKVDEATCVMPGFFLFIFFPPANARSETLSTVPSARHSADNIAVPAGIIGGSHKGTE